MVLVWHLATKSRIVARDSMRLEAGCPLFRRSARVEAGPPGGPLPHFGSLLHLRRGHDAEPLHGGVRRAGLHCPTSGLDNPEPNERMENQSGRSSGPELSCHSVIASRNCVVKAA